MSPPSLLLPPCIILPLRSDAFLVTVNRQDGFPEPIRVVMPYLVRHDPGGVLWIWSYEVDVIVCKKQYDKDKTLQQRCNDLTFIHMS